MFVHFERPQAPCVHVDSGELDELKLVVRAANLHLPPTCLFDFVRIRQAVFVRILDIWQVVIQALSTEANIQNVVPGAHIASKSVSSAL